MVVCFLKHSVVTWYRQYAYNAYNFHTVRNYAYWKTSYEVAVCISYWQFVGCIQYYHSMNLCLRCCNLRWLFAFSLVRWGSLWGQLLPQLVLAAFCRPAHWLLQFTRLFAQLLVHMCPVRCVLYYISCSLHHSLINNKWYSNNDTVSVKVTNSLTYAWYGA